MTGAALPPLPLGADEWRSRWLVLRGSKTLHRVSSIAWDEEWGGKIRGEGVAVCGRRGAMAMPGLFSRLGVSRCPACCRALDIPRGAGAPFNALKGAAADA